MLKRTLGERIDLSTAIMPDLWPVRADPRQIENAVLNLAINARDAMPNGGRLVIEVRNAILDADYVELEPGLQPGRYVLLTVTDNGTGMSDDVLARVFDPFFTTKKKGRGSGLGLSMIYGFAKQSGGHITIYSEVGKGTTVGLYLPSYEAEASPEEPTEEDDAVAGSGERILVVEDDEKVLRLTISRLRSLGYQVETAASGDEALAVLAGDASYDLVFTDLVMPGRTSGLDLAHHVRRSAPGLPLLLTSGYSEDLTNPDELDALGVALLRKPYRLRDLALAIRQALAV